MTFTHRERVLLTVGLLTGVGVGYGVYQLGLAGFYPWAFATVAIPAGLCALGAPSLRVTVPVSLAMALSISVLNVSFHLKRGYYAAYGYRQHTLMNAGMIAIMVLVAGIVTIAWRSLAKVSLSKRG